MRVQSAISPMHVSISTITVGGSNTQLYDTELQEYLPDYRLTPIVIALKAQKEEDGVVSEVISFVDTLVYELVGTGWVQRNSTATFVINTSAGTITIKENTPINSERRFKIDTKIADSRRVDVPYLASVESSIGCKIMSDSPFKLVSEYLDGQGAYVIRPLDNYRLQEKMMKGTTEWIQTYFRWYRRINNVNTEITSENAKGITGLDTGVLSIPYVEIPDRGVSYKCVADPAVDLTGINLISKKMISDDWNAIAPGCSTPGQDADGKYFSIAEGALFVATGRGTEDIFKGRIKYKNNQQYSLSVRCKNLRIPSSSNSPMYIMIIFIDGTYEVLESRTVIAKVVRLITTLGKTIEKITVGYGEATGYLIYDIQLVEYHGATNLVTGGNQFRIPESGVATSSNLSKTLRFSESLRQYLTAGTKLTISYEDVNFIANKNFTGTLSYNDNTGTARVIGFDLSKSKQNSIQVVIAGNTGAGNMTMITATNVGGAVDVTGLMIVVGNTAYKYSPADGEFLPAIPDGAPKPPLSGNAKTDIMVLSRKYPANYNERVVQTYNSNLPGNVENVFGARMDLDTAAGTIQRPELSYSCLWYEKPLGGAESILGRGFNILEAYNETLDIRTEVKQGLDDAKWAAKFNGVDQYLRYTGDIANTSPALDKIYDIVFRVNKKSPNDQNVFQNITVNSSYRHRASLMVLRDGEIRLLVTSNTEVTSIVQSYYTTTPLTHTGDIYRVTMSLNSQGVLTALLVNGVQTPFRVNSGSSEITGPSSLLFGYPNSPCVTILNFKYWKGDYSALFAHYDFQPLNGDRANMLKNKDFNGGGLGRTIYPLTPVNISNLDDLNPLTGFFTTI